MNTLKKIGLIAAFATTAGLVTCGVVKHNKKVDWDKKLQENAKDVKDERAATRKRNEEARAKNTFTDSTAYFPEDSVAVLPVPSPQPQP